jgi:hypothetical protein
LHARSFATEYASSIDSKDDITVDLFDSLCMPDHLPTNMHATDSKDDITVDLLDTLCMPDHLPPNMHATDSKDDIS